MTRLISSLFTFIVLFVFSINVFAQTNFDKTQYFGGWVAYIDGVKKIFYIVIRDGEVSGTYCGPCENTDTISFIDDGRLTEEAIYFSIYHNNDENQFQNEGYIEKVVARRDGKFLKVEHVRQDSFKVIVYYEREPVEPTLDKLPVIPGPPGSVPHLLAGQPEQIKTENILGSWLWGVGPGKQIFTFKSHKKGLRGLVCGPCDRVAAFAPLEKISWSDTNFHFEIVHEDNGIRLAEHGPHSNVVDAVITRNELVLNVVPSFELPGTTPIRMTLLGPIR